MHEFDGYFKLLFFSVNGWLSSKNSQNTLTFTSFIFYFLMMVGVEGKEGGRLT
jgi:hypothetical protein